MPWKQPALQSFLEDKQARLKLGELWRKCIEEGRCSNKERMPLDPVKWRCLIDGIQSMPNLLYLPRQAEIIRDRWSCKQELYEIYFINLELHCTDNQYKQSQGDHTNMQAGSLMLLSQTIGGSYKFLPYKCRGNYLYLIT